jgi:DNA polymerase III subunit delta
MSERALRTAITKRIFEPAYYLHGDDDFRKDDALAALIASAVDPSVRDFNVDVRRGGEIGAEALETALGTPPMMSERRVVALRDAPSLKKDARAVLDRYLAHPASDTVVVLLAPAGSKPEKSLLDRAVSVEITPLSGDRLGEWISKRATVALTPEASALLQDAIGNDLAQMAGELDKLASYVRGRGGEELIDEAAIEAVVGVTREETLGRLLDCIATRDAAGALAALPHVLAQPKTTAVSIVMALTTQTLALAYAMAANKRSSGDFFALLKETGAYPGRAWGEAVNAWVRASTPGSAWSLDALERGIKALLAADVALKESRVSDDEQLLVSLILDLCAP